MTRREIGAGTQQIHEGVFSAHGEANYLYAEDNLVIVSATGPFNLEFMQDLEKVEKPILVDLRARYPRFYAMTTIHNSILLTPDAMVRYASFRMSMAEANLNPCALAFIMTKDVEGRELMRPHFAKLFSASQTSFEVFETQREALTWLKHQGLERP